MNTSDRKIAEVLGKFEEPMAGNVWRVQGTAVIYHKTLERIAAHAKIQFDEPKIIRAERDEAVIQVTGRMGDRVEWSIGEALIGVNYRVSGKQSAYVYAIAEKRAKDRVILKLIELHGYVYSEDEDDEFKQSRPTRGYEDRHEPPKPEPEKAPPGGPPENGGSVETELKSKISKSKTINAVTDLMLSEETRRVLDELPEGVRDEIRDFAKARLVELGWPTSKKPPEQPKTDTGGKLYTATEAEAEERRMMADLKKVRSREELSQWASDNARARDRMPDANKARVRAAFGAKMSENLPARVERDEQETDPVDA